MVWFNNNPPIPNSGLTGYAVNELQGPTYIEDSSQEEEISGAPIPEYKCEPGMICIIYPKQTSTVTPEEIKDNTLELKISTVEKTLCKYHATNPTFNYETTGTLFYSDSDGEHKKNHTQTINAENLGSYKIYYQCKVEGTSTTNTAAISGKTAPAGSIMNTTHNFKIGPKDVEVKIKSVNIDENGDVKVDIDMTAEQKANLGTKTIEIKLQKDDKTIKILDLNTDIEPLEEPAITPKLSSTLKFLLVTLTILSGILTYLLYKYKKTQGNKKSKGNIISGYKPLETQEQSNIQYTL